MSKRYKNMNNTEETHTEAHVTEDHQHLLKSTSANTAEVKMDLTFNPNSACVNLRD